MWNQLTNVSWNQSLVFLNFGKFDFGRTLAELMRIFRRTYGELPQVDCAPQVCLTLAPKDKGRAN
jgi:hypothetical protein